MHVALQLGTNPVGFGVELYTSCFQLSYTQHATQHPEVDVTSYNIKKYRVFTSCMLQCYLRKSPSEGFSRGKRKKCAQLIRRSRAQTIYGHTNGVIAFAPFMVTFGEKWMLRCRLGHTSTPAFLVSGRSEICSSNLIYNVT